LETEKQMRANLALLIAAIRGRDVKPAGWFDVGELRQLFGLVLVNSASNKAKQLFDRGFFERRLMHTIHDNGKHGLSYIYKPAKGYRTPQAALEAMQVSAVQKIPRGWVSIRDYATAAGISPQAVHYMVYRHGLKPRLFRIAANVGCTKPAQHYSKAALNRLHKRRVR
jgi:hypothetical protein